jgi:enterochelin esterase family protein
MSHRLALVLAALSLLATAPLPAGAEPPSQIRVEQAPSPALGRPLHYVLYLPQAAAPPQAKLPVVYLLHGAQGEGMDFVKEGHLQETADAMIASGALPPMLLVMPDGEQSWWVDSASLGGPGDFATAVSRDLVATIEARYAALPARRGRGIAGISMGAFGAFRLAMMHPEEYAAAASLSGAFWTRMSPEIAENPRMQRIFRGAFGTPLDVTRFIAAEPLTLAERLRGAAAAPRFYLTVGNQDRYNLYADAGLLRDKLSAVGAPVKAVFAEGDHDWDFWTRALPDVLAFMNAAFAAAD